MKRTYALGIIVADRLAHVIVEAAVALVVWLLYVWARSRAESADSPVALCIPPSGSPDACG